MCHTRTLIEWRACFPNKVGTDLFSVVFFLHVCVWVSLKTKTTTKNNKINEQEQKTIIEWHTSYVTKKKRKTSFNLCVFVCVLEKKKLVLDVCYYYICLEYIYENDIFLCNNKKIIMNEEKIYKNLNIVF